MYRVCTLHPSVIADASPCSSLLSMPQFPTHSLNKLLLYYSASQNSNIAFGLVSVPIDPYRFGVVKRLLV